MITGFYAALSAAASVFIGILSALLANNLSTLSAQRERIERRIETIDAKIQNLDKQGIEFKSVLDSIREREQIDDRREEAQEQVDEFIEEHVGREFDISPEDLTPRRLQREFSQYLGVDKLNEYQHDELMERYEDIEEVLTPRGPLDIPTTGIDFTSPEATAVHTQIEHQWQIHTEERFNRNYRQWVQTITQMRSLLDERKRLVERHESLDPSHLHKNLRAAVAAICFSVGVPLVAYLLRVSGFVIDQDIPLWLEAGVIFVIWGGGLLYVFYHLRSQIPVQKKELNDPPEIEMDTKFSE